MRRLANLPKPSLRLWRTVISLMSTTSTSKLETIRSRIETEIAKKQFPHLISKAVDFHCRQGIRKGCDCSYCQLKRDSHYKFSRDYYPSYFPTTFNGYETYSYDPYLKWRMEGERFKLRELLLELKHHL